MSRHFTATILTERAWPLDIRALADAVAESYPAIGRIAAQPGDAPEAAGTLTIDGAPVAVRSVAEPVAEERLRPPLKLLRTWDPEPAIAGHAAHVEIACGGELGDLIGAEAHAAAAHFVAAAACALAPAGAVLWHEGWALTRPAGFVEAADALLAGRMPLGAWIGYATIIPRGYAPEAATGMVTYGLRPFIGRELELAPRPGDARSAYRCVAEVARLLLDRGVALHDSQRLEDVDGAFALTVRERRHWLRRDLSAFVLVADDAVVDARTLKPRTRSAA